MPQNIRCQKEKAGVIVYRITESDHVEFLMVSSRKHPGSWVFPIGTVEPNESFPSAAKRECLEEAGYVVMTGMRLPSIVDSMGKVKVRFTYYLANVVGEVADWEKDRSRAWFSSQEVLERLPSVFMDAFNNAMIKINEELEMLGK